jgi:hypothetical protein
MVLLRFISADRWILLAYVATLAAMAILRTVNVETGVRRQRFSSEQRFEKWCRDRLRQVFGIVFVDE